MGNVVRCLWLLFPGVFVAYPVYPQATTRWVRGYPDSTNIEIHTVVTDSAGNIYVSGIENRANQVDRNWITRKILPSGITVWEATVGGPAPYYSYLPAGLQVDRWGDVYVAFSSRGSSGYNGIETVKYNSDGYQLWSDAFSMQPDSQYVSALVTSLALDDAGNAVVAGKIIDTTNHQLDILIKYLDDGTRQWVSRDTIFAAVAFLDNFGNAYLSGSGFRTAKYDVSGNRLWKVTFPTGGVELGTAIAVDEAGSVYVSGSSADYIFGDFFDTWTLKYNSAGVLQWSNKHSGTGNPTPVILDSVLVFVTTGQSIVCYTRAGAQLWDINCAVDSITGISWFSLDRNRNIVATGPSSVEDRWSVASYDRTGSRIEARHATIPYSSSFSVVNGAYAAIDLNGEAVIGVVRDTGAVLRTYPSIAKIDRSGNGAWYEPSGNTVASASAADGTGDIYVTGTAASYLGTGVLTIKYSDAGIPLWAGRYNSAGTLNFAKMIQCDNGGNVIVSGVSTVDGIQRDIFTLKYAPDGTRQWVAHYSGPASLDNIANALRLDSLGYVYITGGSKGQDGLWEWLTLKYTPVGLLQWATMMPGTTHPGAVATSIGLDASRNVFVSGYAYGADSTSSCVTVKYNQVGQQLWMMSYKGSAGVLHTDPSGNTAVTTSIDGGSSQSDVKTVLYSSQGALQWASVYDDSLHSVDQGSAIATDMTGNVFVGGYDTGHGTAEDFLLLKYDENGMLKWTKRFDGDAHGTDILSGIAVDPFGAVYVTGRSYVSGAALEAVTLKYDSDGSQQWLARYSAGSVVPYGLTLTPENNVVVFGGTTGRNRWTTIYYTQPRSTNVSAPTGKRIASFSLTQNYPNPFNPETNIEYVIGVRDQGSGVSMVRLSVYDILGREVTVLVNEAKLPGSYVAKWKASQNASGVYFVTLTAGSFRQTRKMLLIR